MDTSLALPGLFFYLPALVLSPFALVLFESIKALSTGGRFLRSLLIPPLLIACFSPLASGLLPPNPVPDQLGRIFVPAFIGAVLYGAALFGRSWRERLGVFGATAVVLVAYLLVNTRYRFDFEHLHWRAQLATEIATLSDRVHLVGTILAFVILMSALLRRRDPPFRLALDLVALVIGGAALFLPLPCPSRISALEIGNIFSAHVSGKDLYLVARLKEPAPDLFLNELAVLRLRKGERAFDCLWPCKSGFTRRPSDESEGHPRFLVHEQHWWYLLFGSHTAWKVLDGGTGNVETVFRDRLFVGYRQPTRLLVGPGRSWVVASSGEVWGRLESGRRFHLPEEGMWRVPWVRNGKLKVLSRTDNRTVGRASTVTSVDLLSGEVTRVDLLLPDGLDVFFPAGNHGVFPERTDRDGQRLRRLHWLSERNELVLLQDWSAEDEVVTVICPEKGKPTVLPREGNPDTRVRWGTPPIICSEIAGQCLAVEPSVPGGMPSTELPPRNEPRLLQRDLSTGVWKDVALIDGSLQWLDDSVVFVGAELRPPTGWRRDRWCVFRYWPKDGRREVLFSPPGEGLER